MKKIILILLTCAALFSVTQEARAGLNIGISFGAPIRYQRSYDDCQPRYYSRPARYYYREPVYYAPRRRVTRYYYSEPVHYRSSRYYGRACR